MPQTQGFFVTEAGIAAALTDRKVLAQLQQAVLKHRIAPLRRFRSKRWIVPRAVTRVVASSRRLVRYSATGRAPVHSLGNSLAQVYSTLKHTRRGLTTPELTLKLPHMNVNTLRWAVQILRQQQIAKTLPPT